MTQKFLDLFFAGKWHNYGHVSMVLIICFITALFQSHIYTLSLWTMLWSALVGLLLIVFVEAVQAIRPGDTGWNWNDVWWGLRAVVIACGVVGVALILI